jgi:hypothetical protein
MTRWLCAELLYRSRASGGSGTAASRCYKRIYLPSDRAMPRRRGRDFDTAVVCTGEAMDMIHSVEPAAPILRGVVAEAALARRFD